MPCIVLALESVFAVGPKPCFLRAVPHHWPMCGVDTRATILGRLGAQLLAGFVSMTPWLPCPTFLCLVKGTSLRCSNPSWPTLSYMGSGLQYNLMAVPAVLGSLLPWFHAGIFSSTILSYSVWSWLLLLWGLGRHNGPLAHLLHFFSWLLPTAWVASCMHRVCPCPFL